MLSCCPGTRTRCCADRPAVSGLTPITVRGRAWTSAGTHTRRIGCSPTSTWTGTVPTMRCTRSSGAMARLCRIRIQMGADSVEWRTGAARRTGGGHRRLACPRPRCARVGFSRPAISITLALLSWLGRPPRWCTCPPAPGRPCATCWSTQAVRVPSTRAASPRCWARRRAACSDQPGTATPLQAVFRRGRTRGYARSPERICRCSPPPRADAARGAGRKRDDRPACVRLPRG